MNSRFRVNGFLFYFPVIPFSSPFPILSLCHNETLRASSLKKFFSRSRPFWVSFSLRTTPFCTSKHQHGPWTRTNNQTYFGGETKRNWKSKIRNLKIWGRELQNPKSEMKFVCQVERREKRMLRIN